MELNKNNRQNYPSISEAINMAAQILFSSMVHADATEFVLSVVKANGQKWSLMFLRDGGKKALREMEAKENIIQPQPEQKP